MKTPDGHPLQGGYDVVSCDRCGTGFANVAVTQAYYDLYYADAAKYAGEADLADEGDHSAESPHTLQRAEAIADQIVPLLVSRSARVLDIGCANGTLLAALKRRGYENVEGVDPAPESARAARQFNNVHVSTGTFSKMPSGLGKFDVICLLGVLEHVWDVDEAMNTVISFLRPGGKIFVGVPNASRYLDPYISPFEDFGTEHVNHFSATTLGTLAQRFGLEVLWSCEADSELEPGVLAAGVHTVWSRSTLETQQPIKRDDALAISLADFTDRSLRDFSIIDDALNKRLAGHSEFVLWGMGELAMKLLAGTVLSEMTPVALLDGNTGRQGLVFNGLAVSSPDAFEGGDTPIVVGSILRAGSIRSAAAKRGFPNPLIDLI